VKLLGDGEFNTKADFAVYRASKSAIASIEKAGGSVRILAPAEEEGTELKGKSERAAPEVAKGGQKGKAKGGKVKQATEGGERPAE